jgi:hypothetical protein
MKRALVLQHMDHDQPGRFADLFAEDGVVPEFVRLFEGQEIPALANFDLMLGLGPWQAVYRYLPGAPTVVRCPWWKRLESQGGGSRCF